MLPPLSRRQFLALSGSAAAATVVLGACGKSPTPVGPGAAAVAEAEKHRRSAGAAVRDFELTAGLVTLDAGGRVVQTWGYNGVVPGPEIRLAKGEVLRVKLNNQLPDPTSIHWHGLSLRNDMDGVPGVTQNNIDPSSSFTYEFAVPESGTFWFHPHVGLQLDRGLYAPLIIDDPAEPGRYDSEIVVVLDDWTDGVGDAPDAIFNRLTTGASSGPMGMSPLLGGDAGDVNYPLYFLNGRPPSSPATFPAKPGDRVRMRIINAAAETAFRVALGGHRLMVTHSDGFAVEPVTVDAVLMGMGERYDAIVTVSGAGAFPLVAEAEGKGGQALGVLRSGTGTPPTADARPQELDGKVLALGDLKAAAAVALAPATPDRTHQVVLSVDANQYRWRINGRSFDDRIPLEVREGQRVRLIFDNRTTMFHPMHLHGHTFEVVSASGVTGPRKDTLIVRPNEKIAVDFAGDNPGQWLVHCHNIYHMQTGMMTTLSYVH